MPTIEIEVKNKTARSPVDRIVCGNSDYNIKFVFDEAWNAHFVKTARFVYNGYFEDVVFEGNICKAPVIRGATMCAVGVYAGNLCTTTPALIACHKSILCDSGLPADPSPDVYAQIMSLLNNGGSGGGGGGVYFETDETLTLKDGVLSVNTTNEMEQDNTLPMTSAGVYATVGNIEALLKTI